MSVIKYEISGNITEIFNYPTLEPSKQSNMKH